MYAELMNAVQKAMQDETNPLSGLTQKPELS
jgi:hypothetical protein